MSKKLPPEVRAHLHRDVQVTPERVRAFGKADYALRLRVLAVLRERSSDQSMTSMVAIFAIAISLIFVFVKPPHAFELTGEAWVNLVTMLLIPVLIVLMLLPAIVPDALGNSSQSRARVWLGAYEDELVRRQSRAKKRS